NFAFSQRFRSESLMAALSENLLTVSILLCLFFLPGTLETCSHKPRLFIRSLQTMKALSGSCLHIPCNFGIKPEKELEDENPIYGIWIKSDLRFAMAPQNVVFNSSKSVNIFQMNIAGNLRARDCTTLFSNLRANQMDVYYFRMENGHFMSTASCNPIRIEVEDSPWTPTINISAGDLKEHQSVTVTCSAFTPCPHSPPELTWNLQQDSLRQTEKNTDGTFTTKIQENITLSDTHDGYNIRCSARYPVIGGNKTAETEVTLSVSYAPKYTSASISPSSLVSAGSWVELSCSSRAKPPIRSFTWFRNSEHGAVKVAVGQVYRLQMTNMTDLRSYYCEAENILGRQTSKWCYSKEP
ncbi:sialoadhesin-like, partial [Poecilia latipinna]|uniref:sialoadhesin-like n=1 Tax=Poecilia latipinna TaxID=48699 RepID=UPI00072EED46